MIDKAWVIFLLSLPRHWTIVDVGGCFWIFCWLVSLRSSIQTHSISKHNTTLSADSMLQIGFGLQERSSNNLYKLGTYFTGFVGNRKHVSVVIGVDTPSFTAVTSLSYRVASMRSRGLWRRRKQSCSVQKKRWNDFRRIQKGWGWKGRRWYIWHCNAGNIV